MAAGASVRSESDASAMQFKRPRALRPRMPGEKDQEEPSVKRGEMKTEPPAREMKTEPPAQEQAIREEREDEEARPLE